MPGLSIRVVGMAGARRAVRRWFRRGRGSPPDDSSSSSSDEENDGLAVPPAPPNSPADLSLISEGDEDNNNNNDDHPDQQPVGEDSDTYFDDTDYDQDFYDDSSTMSLNMFVPTISSMQRAAAAKGQDGDEPQPPTDRDARDNEHHREPQQPSDRDASDRDRQQPQQSSDSDADEDEHEQSRQLTDSETEEEEQSQQQLTDSSVQENEHERPQQLANANAQDNEHEQPQQLADANAQQSEQLQQLTDANAQENEQLQQQPANANAQENEREQLQQLADAKPQQSEQPQQLADAKVEAVTEQVSNINLVRIDEPVVAVTKPLSFPGDGDATTAEPIDPAVLADRATHQKFIGQALDMARLALVTNETPVGCVIVYKDEVIARGMNATNVTRNGTRHAELMAIAALMSVAKPGEPKTTSLKPGADKGNEDGRKGHLYPYGQKELPQERVDGNILRECTLYVTVEPCVMCASLLRQVGIKKVYFGAVNDKFGGTGGVFNIHRNAGPVSNNGQACCAGGGDGGSIESGYVAEGGWGRDEAVALLRRFYVQENGRAPVPRKKEGRAARLAAMMEAEGAASSSTSVSGPEAKAANDVKDAKDVQDAQHAEGGNAAAKENVEPRTAQPANKGKEPATL